MSLIVFDMGRRVETPVRPEKFRVKATGATEGVVPVHAGHNDDTARNHVAERYGLHEKEPESIAFAGDIMHTPVRTLKEDATINDAWHEITLSGYHHLPVTNDQLEILAIVSDRDLMHALIGDPAVRHNKVLPYASRPVLCVHKETDIRQVSNILFQYNIGALPVVGEHNILTGIITRTDILKLLSHYGPMELWA